MPDVHLSRIEPHPANIREDLGDLAELTASVRVHGILQPLVVQPHPTRENAYQLLAGHRRLAAAKRARLEIVPVVIKAAQAPAHALEIMLIENCQRRDLGPIEKAETMGALRNHGLTAAQIARRTGLSPATVSHFLTLLDLDEASRALVTAGQVKVGDAIKAVRKVRKVTRGGADGRSARAERAWLTSNHRLSRSARALCDASGHGARPQVGAVACGQCWEQAIRDDQRRADAPPEPEPERLTVRQERMEIVAGMRMHHGSDPCPPGHVTAQEAAERLGVTARTVERYKADLAMAGAS